MRTKEEIEKEVEALRALKPQGEFARANRIGLAIEELLHGVDDTGEDWGELAENEGPGEEDGPWAAGHTGRTGRPANHELRLKVAAIRGFTNIADERWENVDIESRSVCSGMALMGDLNGERVPVPDYPNDLNAMREAENHIPKEHRDVYGNCLMSEVGFDGKVTLLDDYDQPVKSDSTSLFSLVNADAETRAKAVVATHATIEKYNTRP